MNLSKPLPILLTTRELNTGGIECDVTKIAIHLDRSRFEPHVACYRTGGIRFEELQRAGVPILHLPVTSLQRPSALAAAIRMRRYIREHGILLVHAYDASAVFVATLARAFGVPAVLSSLLGDRNLLDARSRRQVRWTDRMVDRVVVNCEAMRRQLVHEEHVASGAHRAVLQRRGHRPVPSGREFQTRAVCQMHRLSSERFAFCARRKRSGCCRKLSLACVT